MGVYLDNLELTPYLLVHIHYPSDVARFATRKEAREAKAKKYGSSNYIIVKVKYIKESN